MSDGPRIPSIAGKPVLVEGGRAPPRARERPVVPITPALAARRAEYVRENIATVRQLQAEGFSDAAIYDRVKLFADGFPYIYKFLISNDPENAAHLARSLELLDRMATAELSQHEASVIVGRESFDAYNPHGGANAR
jgi:hypothetical protein